MNAAVQKAVVLAAGRGTRLGALAADLPKPLLSVGGEPVLFRIVRGLAAAGLREVCIVVGYRGEQIRDALGNGAHWQINISYVEQISPDGTANALKLCRDWLGTGAFFVGWGDILVEPHQYARVVEASRQDEAVVAVNPTKDPSGGAAVVVGPDLRISSLVEKPPAGSIETPWNNAGLMVLPPAIWEFIERLEPSPRGEYELPQAVAAMIEAGIPTHAVPIEDGWFDIGSPESLREARARYGD